MSASPSPCSQSVIVTRLRAAGCVFAEDEGRLLVSAARTPADLDAMVDQRVAGAPLEHVIGWAEFCGLRITVDPGVFVPRRRTEFLVRQAVTPPRPPRGPAGPAPAPRRPEFRPPRPAAPPRPARSPAGPAPSSDHRQVVVVDLCCGSGAVGAALAAALGQIELHATDVDPAAGACARRYGAAPRGQG